MPPQEKSALTENFVIRLTSKEKVLIERYAKKEGFKSASEYARATLLVDLAFMYGSREAWKIVFESGKERFFKMYKKKLSPLFGKFSDV